MADPRDFWPNSADFQWALLSILFLVSLAMTLKFHLFL